MGVFKTNTGPLATWIWEKEYFMGIEIKCLKIDLNKSGTFTFNGTVSTNYVMGISSFNLAYEENKKHKILDLGISLSATLNNNSVIVTPTLTMNDDSGNYCSNESYVIVTVIAAIGDSSQGNYSLGNLTNISDAAASQDISVHQDNVVHANALLSGFNFAYSGGDNNIEDLIAGCGIVKCDYQTISITAAAKMNDDDGHKASMATIDAGYLLSYIDVMQIQFFFANSSISVGNTAPFKNGVTKAHALMTSFKFEHGANDDGVNGIMGGVPTCYLKDEDDYYYLPIQPDGSVFIERASALYGATKYHSSLMIMGSRNFIK